LMLNDCYFFAYSYSVDQLDIHFAILCIGPFHMLMVMP
jgi:hypothetical protein